jgi:hypothetical protein
MARKTDEEKAAAKARKTYIKDKIKAAGKTEEERIDDLADVVVSLVDMVSELEARVAYLEK